MALTTALLEHERIHTTRAKADFVRGHVEQLITLAKLGQAADALLEAAPHAFAVKSGRRHQYEAIGFLPHGERLEPGFEDDGRSVGSESAQNAVPEFGG